MALIEGAYGTRAFGWAFMQRSGMGVGIWVFGASAFVLGAVGAWGSLALKHGTFALSGIGAFGFRRRCRALRQRCSASGWFFWRA